MPELTYLEAINAALHDEMEADPRVFCMGEDVGRQGGAFGATKGLQQAYGELGREATGLTQLYARQAGLKLLSAKKLELATGLSVAYTLKVLGRFGRFATRVLGPDPSPEEYNKLKADLTALGARLLSQKDALDKAVADQRQTTRRGAHGPALLDRAGRGVHRQDAGPWPAVTPARGPLVISRRQSSDPAGGR